MTIDGNQVQIMIHELLKKSLSQFIALLSIFLINNRYYVVISCQLESMGQIFSRFDLLKSPKRPKGPPRRPPSVKSRRSATMKKATLDVSKADLDSVTTEVGSVLQNPNKNRAQRPQNRRPPARARQTKTESSPSGDTLIKANYKNKPEPPETKKPENFSEVDAVHPRLSEKKFLIPPTSNNSVNRQQSGDVVEKFNTEDEERTESEYSNDAHTTKKKQRKSSKVFSLG